ncbi:TRAP transporter small permease [Marinomonas sp. 15G1-11]|uniref:TRAP transporter small permease protein n=1 Tax=Marinomonas phaeophyticola TaxID=3004091 RepID=A0ABT4JSW8_9GAMM|nr:TRAP transporter small permease [Marinomonas sp. 15G1-11]MCZ2721491.1 TRAP transporter small permease [Marinomonas sp. 15G1-11]
MFTPHLLSALDKLYKTAGALAALCLVAMTVCVITSIVSRLLSLYVPGLTEIAGYLMGASNCLALAYTFRNKAHIQVTLFVEMLTPIGQKVASIFALAVTALVTAYLSYYMVRLTYFSWDFHELSDGSIALPLWIPQSVVAFGTVILAISLVHSLIEYCVMAKKGTANESTDLLGVK